MTVAIDLLVEPPVIEPGVSLSSVSEQVSSRILRPETPLWWWAGFGVGTALLLVLVIAVSWLFVNGIGVWGVDIPVAWGWRSPSTSGGSRWRAAARSYRHCFI